MGISLWQLIIVIALVVIPVLISVPVVRKAGFTRWWALIMIVPVVNLIMVWVFAFVDWPAEKKT